MNFRFFFLLKLIYIKIKENFNFVLLIFKSIKLFSKKYKLYNLNLKLFTFITFLSQIKI